MPLHIYYCAECGQTTKKLVMPKTDNCPDSKFHRWANIGVEGMEGFECMNCKVKVYTTKPPNTYGCRKSVFHEWRKS